MFQRWLSWCCLLRFNVLVCSFFFLGCNGYKEQHFSLKAIFRISGSSLVTRLNCPAKTQCDMFLSTAWQHISFLTKQQNTAVLMSRQVKRSDSGMEEALDASSTKLKAVIRIPTSHFPTTEDHLMFCAQTLASCWVLFSPRVVQIAFHIAKCEETKKHKQFLPVHASTGVPGYAWFFAKMFTPVSVFWRSIEGSCAVWMRTDHFISVVTWRRLTPSILQSCILSLSCDSFCTLDKWVNRQVISSENTMFYANNAQFGCSFWSINWRRFVRHYRTFQKPPSPPPVFNFPNADNFIQN